MTDNIFPVEKHLLSPAFVFSSVSCNPTSESLVNWANHLYFITALCTHVILDKHDEIPEDECVNGIKACLLLSSVKYYSNSNTEHTGKSRTYTFCHINNFDLYMETCKYKILKMPHYTIINGGNLAKIFLRWRHFLLWRK